VPVPDDAGAEARARFAEQAFLEHWDAEDEGFSCRALPRPASGGFEHDADFRALDPAYLRFTSGTTSVRKGVVLSHARIAERLEAANAGLRIGPDDRILWLLPMAHHFVVSVLLYLRFGATILLPRSSLARPVLELAARERATVSYASPFHYHLLSRDASDLLGLDVRLAVSTAEGLRGDVAARFRARFGLPLSQALGIIEVGLPVLNAAEAATKPLALGRPLPTYDVWLRAEDGRALEGPGSPERTGEICIRGPGLFDAYLSPWTPSEGLVQPDGFRTGDQGFFDADGTLFLAGRRHNRINMAGMKFFGEEVEEVLARHPGVRECRVFAREHPRLGEIPVAEIVPEDPEAPPAKRELLAACREALPAYKVPRELHVVAELARTETGKLQR
jgi:long-chain acyl-CoA synthetase